MFRLRMMWMIGIAAGLAGCNADRSEPPGSDAPDQVGNQDGDGNGSDAGDGGGGGTDNGNGSGSVDAPAEANVAELQRFDSPEALEAFFKDQILAQNSAFGGVELGEDGEPPRDESDSAGQDAATGGAGDADDSLDAAPLAPSANGGDAGAESAEDGDFSGTTIQEAGVDESDVIKTDGEYIYIMQNSRLQIVQAAPASDLAVMGGIDLDGYGSQLYLVDDMIVALTTVYRDRPEPGIVVVDDLPIPIEPGMGDSVDDQAVDPATGVDDAATDVLSDDSGEVDSDDIEFADDEFIIEPFFPGFIPRPQTALTFIDVSNRSSPELIGQMRFDGTVAASRMIDGVMRLVVVNYSWDFRDLMPLGAPSSELPLDQLNLDDLLPNYVYTDAAGQTTEGNIVEWDEFYRPSDADGFGVTAVVTLDTRQPSAITGTAIVAEPGNVYSSLEALYLTDTDYYYDFRRTTTDIYKFAYEDGGVRLAGAGTVPGRILNQYSMGEYEGYLRVATTTDGLFFWESDQAVPSSNAVYVLGEVSGATGATSLEIVGRVEGMAEGEQIQSARFIGPRGYVVTFEQIDPLHTLDLSDPANPQVIGELHVPGFSTFIVPMDDNHLLTVGVYVDPDGFGFQNGVQLSIYDISDFANPVQAFNEVIGDQSTYSEAIWNPKAFTYFREQAVLALPIEHYAWDVFVDEDVAFGGEDLPVPEDGESANSDGDDAEAGQGMPVPPVRPRQEPSPLFDDEPFRGVLVYSVTPEFGFSYLGSLSTEPVDSGDDYFYYPSFTRGLFIGDHTYAVTDVFVSAAPTVSLSNVTGSVSLPNPFDFEPGIDFGDGIGDGATGSSGGGAASSDGDAGEPE